LLCLLFVCLFPATGWTQKERLYESIKQRESQSWEAAISIWKWAEPGYQETRSAELLASMLQQHGFTIQRPVAKIPTAFIATFGTEKPVLALLGEYDALPGLSQEATPVRTPRSDTTYGHGCGHHLFGVASASAAIAIAEQIKQGRLRGSVRFYGCPAEEGGSAKVFMVRDGLFHDCDVALHWHPASQNAAGDRSSLARMAVKFQFLGRSAHAAGAPDQGRSALDAVELTNHAAELLREHVPDRTRIHHVITAGGAAPNIVPDFAEVYYYIRHPDSHVLRPLYQRLLLCAQAGALATETELRIDFEGGIVEILPNNVLAQVTLKNLRALNDLRYTEEDLQFATRLQQTLPRPAPLESIEHVADSSGTIGMGSTDVGDVSWVVPTTGFTTACFVPGTPGHTWQAVASGGTPIARRGMDLAARVLAATAWDLLSDHRIVVAARNEHQQRIGRQKYQPLIEPDQAPPLNYRRPAQRNSPTEAADGPADASAGPVQE
jgi:aminobenzoyl-glutamate utilization protein B